MNKKSHWYIPIILLMLGGIMIALGTYYGGMKDIQNITTSSALAKVTHLSVDLPFIEFGEKKSSKTAASAGDHFNVQDIDSFDIDIKNASLVFVNSEDANEISVATDNVGSCDCYVDGKTLCIKNTSNNPSNALITIYVPEKFECKKMKISEDAGTIEADSIFCVDLILDIGAGSAELNNVLVENTIEADVGAGELVINDSKAQNLAVSVGMGSINYSGVVYNRLKADCGMGSIYLGLEDEYESHNYDVETDMGTITIDDEDFGGFKSKHHIDNKTESDFVLTCGMGSIEVDF